MARVIGYVKSVENGVFYKKDVKGNLHQLKAGEAIQEGELVFGAKSNPANAQIVIDVTLDNAGDLVIAGNGALHFDTSLLAGIFSHDDAVVYVESVKDALALADGSLTGDSNTQANPLDVTDAGNENETAAGQSVTDQERLSDTFNNRDGLIQDVSTSLSGTAPSANTTTIDTTVSPVLLQTENTPPVAVNDTLSTKEDTPITFNATDLLANDTDLDGDTLVVTAIGNPANGTVVLNPDGTVTFTPDENFNGTATFDYSISDGNGGTSTATVTVNVISVNDAPTVSAVSSTASEDDPSYTINLLNASNAQDIDGDTVTYVADSATVISSTDAGGISISSDGVASVDPSYYEYLDANESVVVTYDFYVTDGTAQVKNTATITINGAEDPSQITVNSGNGDSDTGSVTEDATDPTLSTTGTLTVTDVDTSDTAAFDPSATSLKSSTASGTLGSLSIDAAGAWTYTVDNSAVQYLDAGESETLVYTVKTTDGQTHDITITINGANDVPTISVDTGNANNANDTVYESALSVGSNPASNGEFAGGTFTVGDVDGLDDIHSISIGSTELVIGSSGLAGLVGSTAYPTAYGQVTLTGYSNGTFSYTYELTQNTMDFPNQTETDSFILKVTDNDGLSAQTTVTMNVIDDVPSVLPVTASVEEGTSITSTAQDDIVFILDRSGSMTTSAKQSIKDGIANLFDSGSVHAVFIVSFAEGATVENNGAWYTDKASAMEAVNRVYDGVTYTDSRGTDYDAAIAKVTSTFTAPPAGGDRLITIFMSDGQPNQDNGTGSIGILESDTDVGGIGEESAWYNFLSSHGFSESYAIGFDGVTTTYQLEPIAWTSGETAGTYIDAANSTTSSDGNVMVLSSSSQIIDALVSTQPTAQVLEGSLVNNGGGTITATSGADGWIVYGMPIYSASFGTQSHVFTSSTDSYTYDLGNVGSVIIYGDGHYKFTGSTVDIANDLSAVVNFSVKDGDGDVVNSTFTLTVKDSSEVYAYDNENGAVVGTNSALVPDVSLHDSRYNGLSTAGEYTSAEFTMTNGSNISFNIAVANKATNDSDFVWQVQKYSNGSWSIVDSGSSAVSTSIVTNSVTSDGSYRLYFAANDKTNNNLSYTVDITNITLHQITAASGNVLTDSMNLVSSKDAWGATDSVGSEGAVLSVYNGASYIDTTTSGISVSGIYGTLLIKNDGSYTYTPSSSAIAGQEETFTYKLTQPDGDSDTAVLHIKIDSSAYVAQTPITGTPGDDTLTGTSGNDVILGGDGNDTIIGGLGQNHLEGGAGNDTLIASMSDYLIDGGAGIDTLIFANSTSIDFSALNTANNPIKNIEVIDLSQNGDHNLTHLSYADVIDMTDANNTLKILGDSSADKVQLNQADGWTNTGTVTESGHTFDVYTAAGVNPDDPTVTVKIEQVIDNTLG